MANNIVTKNNVQSAPVQNDAVVLSGYNQSANTNAWLYVQIILILIGLLVLALAIIPNIKRIVKGHNNVNLKLPTNKPKTV